MNRRYRTLLGVSGLAAALAVGAGALLWGGRLPEPVSGLMSGMAGALAGLGIFALATAWWARRLSPEQRKEMARNRRGARNRTIRGRAACPSWYWTVFLLWGLYALTLILRGGMYIALVCGLLVPHGIFYMVNPGRWAKQL